MLYNTTVVPSAVLLRAIPDGAAGPGGSSFKWLGNCTPMGVLSIRCCWSLDNKFVFRSFSSFYAWLSRRSWGSCWLVGWL